MSKITILLIIVLILSVCHSKLSLKNKVTSKGGYSGSCSATTFDPSTNILSSRCKNAIGRSVYTKLNLNTCLGNDNGQLAIGRDNFSNSCSGCTLTNGDFQCVSCKTNNNSNITPIPLKLDNFISNSNGELVCDSTNSLVTSFGGYTQSCKGTTFDLMNKTLNSTCQNANGNSVNTRLNLDNCFANYDGVLTKGGFYSKTCTNCSFKDDQLTCSCLKASGVTSNSSTVFLNRFIGNIIGILTC